MSRSFTCIPEMARLQWEKLLRWLFPKPHTSSYSRQTLCISYLVCLFTFFTVDILIYPSIFRLLDIDLFWRSSLSRIVMYEPSLSHEKVYFFNITNSPDFLKAGVDLHVTEVGPYVYRVRTERKNPILGDEDKTISYSEVREYEFLPDESNGSLDDEITTWNGPFTIVAESLKKSNCSVGKEFLHSLDLTMESVIIKKKVKELVFGHYHDDLLEKASLARLSVPYKDGNFSWLDKRKQEDFAVSTGISSEGYPGTVKKWNGRDKLNFWNGDTCNKMDGAISDVGPPYPYEDHHYSLFLPDLCRSLTFLRVKDGEWAVTRKTFANSTENPDNYCYETQGPRPSGVYSVSSCRSGAPLWISFPHFYLGDPSLAKNIKGLEASGKRHGSYFRVSKDHQRDVELKLSTQINIEVGETCDIPQFNNVPKGIYPILWSTVDIKGSDRAWWLMGFVSLNVLRGIIFKYPVVIFMGVLAILTILNIFNMIPFLFITDGRRNLGI